MSNYLKKIGKNARIASFSLINVKKKSAVLEQFQKYIKYNKKLILKENNKDLINAKRKKIKDSFIDRLLLDEKKLEEIRNSINKINKFKDPVGKVLSSWTRPNGMNIQKISIPMGVLGVIYESRPNVTCDISCLSFKTGNVVILKGGSEAINSNKIFVNLFRKSLKINKINQDFVQLIENKNRKLVNYMLSNMKEYIDVIIPRGGKNLTEKVLKLSKVPTIGHLEGICHVYVDRDSDLKMSLKVLANSKMRKTSICGAAETLLIDKKCLKTHCQPLLSYLDNLGCLIKGDSEIQKHFSKKIVKATKKDWITEYLASIISVKSVDGVDEAINHINKYGTMHTDTIVTKNKKTAQKFLSKINSAIAMHNISTQFADGGEFGFGAEVGISTGKLPPRGPVGINQLLTYKYILKGNGQIRK